MKCDRKADTLQLKEPVKGLSQVRQEVGNRGIEVLTLEAFGGRNRITLEP